MIEQVTYPFQENKISYTAIIIITGILGLLIYGTYFTKDDSGENNPLSFL